MAYKFEEKINVIDKELEKRRSRWQLKAISYIDYDDVKQMIRFHIFKKWNMWDQSKPLEPWLNRVISHQLSNIVRNYYGSFSRPCLQNGGCAANQGGDLCGIYGKQCNACPLFAKWSKTKKRAYNVKMPLSLENHPNTTNISQEVEYESLASQIHTKIQTFLNPAQKTIYQLLYIEKRSDMEVAQKMGYKRTNTSRKKPRYKQLENHKRKFVQLAKKIIEEENLII